MPITFDRDKKRYRFQFNRLVDGRRYRASRLLPAGWTLAQAEKYDRTEVAKLYALASGVEQRTPLISEAVMLYIKHKLPGSRNEKNTTAQLAILQPWYAGKTLDELPDVARKYATDSRAELKPATVRNRLAYLRAAARYAYKHHNLGTSDYGARMALPRVQNARHVYLRAEEVNALLSVCSPDLQAIVRLAFYTGLRWVSELMPRQPEDVIKAGRDWWLRVPDTKNGTPFMVAIHPACRKDVGRFPFRHHWRTYYAEFETAREAIGRPDLHMHDLRHSLASVLISGGATLAEVGKALNHKTAQSTARYAHVYPERVAQLVKRIPTLKGKKSASA